MVSTVCAFFFNLIWTLYQLIKAKLLYIVKNKNKSNMIEIYIRILVKLDTVETQKACVFNGSSKGLPARVPPARLLKVGGWVWG